MIYGLYLSATGIIGSSYRQDVIANNLANSESVGFKRNLAMFQERQTALHERNNAGDWSDPMLEHLGGGMLASATQVDRSQGELDHTGNTLDLAIEGNGYFNVADGNQSRLTRDGRMMMNGKGELILSNGKNQHLLDVNNKPITLEVGKPTAITKDGEISQGGKPVARLALMDVPDREKLQQEGNSMLSYPDMSQLKPATGQVHSEYVEHANVDPTTELAELMDTQRQLEANANMIRYQDETLQRLVNDVGKIS